MNSPGKYALVADAHPFYLDLPQTHGCLFCDWTFVGTAGEGMELQRAHARSHKPTLVSSRRLTIVPDDGITWDEVREVARLLTGVA